MTWYPVACSLCILGMWSPDWEALMVLLWPRFTHPLDRCNQVLRPYSGRMGNGLVRFMVGRWGSNADFNPPLQSCLDRTIKLVIEICRGAEINRALSEIPQSLGSNRLIFVESLRPSFGGHVIEVLSLLPSDNNAGFCAEPANRVSHLSHLVARN